MELTDSLSRMRAIDLDELNARAPLLARSDRKYVVGQWLLPVLYQRLEPTHDALVVGGARAAQYSSVYFDGAHHEMHRAHLQGRRLRWKARTRLYGDSGLCFREVKVKGPRGSTRKVRQPCDPLAHGRADDELSRFVDRVLRAEYGHGLDLQLTPALTVTYLRSTLAARDNQERLTVDSGLAVALPGAASAGGLRDDLALLEVKTRTERSNLDRLLVGLGQRPVQLSKYGAGLALASPAVRPGSLHAALQRWFAAAARAPVAVQGQPPVAGRQAPALRLTA